MLIELRAGDRVEENLRPIGRVADRASTLLRTPNSRTQDVGGRPSVANSVPSDCPVCWAESPGGVGGASSNPPRVQRARPLVRSGRVERPPADEPVRAAEIIAAVCLATDLGMGFPFEHGLYGTLAAMRLGECLGIGAPTASEVYYGSLLTYAGCTADAEVAASIFGDDLARHLVPVLHGSPRESLAALLRALPPPERAGPLRAIEIARRLPRAARADRPHLARAVRRGAHAGRTTRPAPSGHRAVRLPHRALGRERTARARREGRDPAADPDRARGARRRLSDAARRGGAGRRRRPRAGGSCVRSRGRARAGRQRRGDPRRGRRRVGVGDDAGQRARAAADAGRGRDRPRARRDGRLRRPALTVSRRPLRRCRPAGRGSGSSLPDRRGRRRHDPARGAGP